LSFDRTVAYITTRIQE